MMTSLAERAAGPIPRRVLWIGLPIAYVLLTGMFVCSGFPYDRVGEQIAAQLETATGVPVQIGELRPHISLLGPGVEARDVRATPAGGPPLQIERLMLRPAWSLGWLRGEPSVVLAIDTAYGNAAGAVSLGAPRRLEGELREVDLGAGPLANTLPDVGLQGRLAADFDLSLADDGPRGDVSFEVLDGAVMLPGSPIGLPFESVVGELRIGDGPSLEVKRLTLEGPLLRANLEGRVAAAPATSLANAVLQLQASFEAKDAAGQMALRGLGIRLDREGRGTIRIGGTLQSPRLR